jgi:hypothetical protein
MEPLFISRQATGYRLPVVVDSELPKVDQVELERAVLVELADYRRVLIPASFITDFHSTPPWSQSLLPAYNNKTNLAAVVHDFLYMEWEQFLAVYPELQQADGRQYADAVYLELMERFNRGRFRNRLYLAGVRWLGRWNWQRFRKQNALS